MVICAECGRTFNSEDNEEVCWFCQEELYKEDGVEVN